MRRQPLGSHIFSFLFNYFTTKNITNSLDCTSPQLWRRDFSISLQHCPSGFIINKNDEREWRVIHVSCTPLNSVLRPGRVSYHSGPEIPPLLATARWLPARKAFVLAGASSGRCRIRLQLSLPFGVGARSRFCEGECQRPASH